MGDTLARTIASVMNQIDERFELIIIDDGSTDSSREALGVLSLKHQNLSIYSLNRDRKRRLGETRNQSIKLANGEWCLFHIDMDDLIGPHLLDFVKCVELIDANLEGDYLYSGKQIHMARKSFLLEQGPFKNIYRGEDRDFYERLAPIKRWIIIDHVRFVQRMPRNRRKLLRKKIFDVWDQTITDLQFSHNPINYFLASAKKFRQLKPRRFFLRALLIPVTYPIAIRRGFFYDAEKLTLEEFIEYRQSHTKTLSSWMDKLGIKRESRKDISDSIFP
jgi:glycosyltransferase involved in cell wall biosynthesis